MKGEGRVPVIREWNEMTATLSRNRAFSAAGVLPLPARRWGKLMKPLDVLNVITRAALRRDSKFYRVAPSSCSC